jgi:hypothetical protein
MKRTSALFRLSLMLNIVLVLWLLRQRRTIQDFNRTTDESSGLLDQMNLDLSDANERLHQLGQEMKTQNLSTIASNDQLDAFLEEYRKNVNR